MSLNSQRAVLVGGTSGIGFGVAKLLLETTSISHLIVASSNSQKVESALDRLKPLAKEGVKLSGEVVDVSSEEKVKSVMEKIGEVDHVVFTSGDPFNRGGKSFKESDLDSYRQSYEVRFWGALRVARHAKLAKSSSSSITFTSGVLAFAPTPQIHIGVAPAGALHTATLGLAVDLAPIRVNIVSPGAIRTEIWETFGMPPEQLEGVLKGYADKLLVKHVGSPEDAAEAYVFLMKCKFITGETIHINGGQILAP